jgi:TIR domain
MSSLADLPELVGFFSYSREDDEDSYGGLSALRERIQRELRAQLGRSMKTFRLWQDKEAIAAGKLWETEIKTAVAQSVFFIPIVTPTVIHSPYCRFELESFLAREAELGRDDVVFPILYIRVPALEDEAQLKNDPILSIVAKRQYVDWREFRLRDINSTEVKAAVERFCANICDTLHRPWISPQERQASEQAAALQRAEEERRRQEAEAKRREEDERRKAEAQAQERAEAERRAREAEIARQQAEAAWQRTEADVKRRAEEEERRRAAEAATRLQLQAQTAFERAKRDDSVVAVAKFLEAYGQSDFGAEARALHARLLGREQAYQEAMASGEPTALQSFLAAYPTGALAEAVRRRLRPSRQLPLKRLGIAGLGAAVLVAIVVWFLNSPPTEAPPPGPAASAPPATPSAAPAPVATPPATPAPAPAAAPPASKPPAAAPAAPAPLVPAFPDEAHTLRPRPPAPAPAPPQAAASPSKPTQILDAAAVRRLKASRGIAVQWISWDYLGRLNVTDSDGIIHLEGSQIEQKGPGRLELSGDVVSIDRDSFTFKGRINILQAPGDRAECRRDGVFEFRITGSRHYWRLQQMEACDGLTDYVDIFF